MKHLTVHNRVTKSQLSLKPGNLVEVTHDDGSKTCHSVFSEPWKLNEHTWVISLHGITGAFALCRCKKLKVEPA